jgi:hypothetical protein
MKTITANRSLGGRMLGWAIMTLACVGYFLSEAVCAPIVEDDGSAGTQAPRADQSDRGLSGFEAASQPLPTRGASDQ